MIRIAALALFLAPCSLLASIHDQLIEAVKANRIDEVEALLKAGADPNVASCEVIINRVKRKCDWDLSLWDDPAYTKPRIDSPSMSATIQGRILNATCLFFARDNNNMDMVSLLIRSNVDLNALITFEGQEIIEDRADPDKPQIVIKKHHISTHVGELYDILFHMLGLNYAAKDDRAGRKIDQN